MGLLSGRFGAGRSLCGERMVVNGQVRPRQIAVEIAGRKQPRWIMVYQEPRSPEVALCGNQVPDFHGVACGPEGHGSALGARGCATAVEWRRRLMLHGYLVLEKLRKLDDLKRKGA
jgi:hypothetical protein